MGQLAQSKAQASSKHLHKPCTAGRASKQWCSGGEILTAEVLLGVNTGTYTSPQSTSKGGGTYYFLLALPASQGAVLLSSGCGERGHVRCMGNGVCAWAE